MIRVGRGGKALFVRPDVSKGRGGFDGARPEISGNCRSLMAGSTWLAIMPGYQAPISYSRRFPEEDWEHCHRHEPDRRLVVHEVRDPANAQAKEWRHCQRFVGGGIGGWLV